MEPRYIVCWLSIYFEISSSLLQVALVDPVVRISYAVPVDPVVGASSPEITTIGIRAYNHFEQSVPFILRHQFQFSLTDKRDHERLSQVERL